MRSIIAQTDRVVTYTKAAIALHNYLRTTESSIYCPPGFTDGEDREGNVIDGVWWNDEEQSTGMEPVARTSSNRYVIMTMMIIIVHVQIAITNSLLYSRHSRSAASICDSYKDHFNSSQGEVSWQYSHVRRTH